MTVTPLSHRQPDAAEDSWSEHLAGLLEPNWRPTEWDPASLRFTFNPDLDETLGRWCMAGCGRITYTTTYCTTCDHHGGAKGTRKRFLVEEGYDSNRCIIANSTARCEGWVRKDGLCQRHYSRFIKSQLPLTEWLATTHAQPLVLFCKVPACLQETKREHSRVLCVFHLAEYQSAVTGLPQDEWAKTAERKFPAGTVSLGAVHETFRNELLFALQSDDRSRFRCSPQITANIVRMARRERLVSILDPAFSPEAFALYPNRKRINPDHLGKARRWLTTIQREHNSFAGTDLTAGDVWDLTLVGLRYPSTNNAETRRPFSDPLDFTSIRQIWLRELAKAYVRDVLPDRTEARRTVRGMTVLSEVMAARGNSEDPTTAHLTDITRAVAAINAATYTTRDGRKVQYSYGVRAALISGVRNVLAHGRSQALMDGVPTGFTFTRHHKVANPKTGSANKSVPHRAVAQLIDALPRFVVTNPKAPGCVLTPDDQTRLLRTSLQVQIDTGRRGGEVRSLLRDCLRTHSREKGLTTYSLVYDNHKAGRMQRVIPILPETAAAIIDWRTHLETLRIPRSDEGWLFPSLSTGRSGGSGRLTTASFGDALDSLVELASPLDSDIPDPNSPTGYAPFTKRITPHMFRHSYAQRLADAGVAIDTMSELLDHMSLDTTKGYYAISDKRKREAVDLVTRFTSDRLGHVRDGSTALSMYAIQTVAVPFGNCAEPSNVKAGGQACPTKFTCCGCDHFRPDPSHLPVLREHLTELRGNLALVEAGQFAADWVVDSAREEIRAYQVIIKGLDDAIAALPAHERQTVEDAAATLHNGRAALTRIPLTITAI